MHILIANSLMVLLFGLSAWAQEDRSLLTNAEEVNLPFVFRALEKSLTVAVEFPILSEFVQNNHTPSGLQTRFRYHFHAMFRFRRQVPTHATAAFHPHFYEKAGPIFERLDLLFAKNAIQTGSQAPSFEARLAERFYNSSNFLTLDDVDFFVAEAMREENIEYDGLIALAKYGSSYELIGRMRPLFIRIHKKIIHAIVLATYKSGNFQSQGGLQTRLPACFALSKNGISRAKLQLIAPKNANLAQPDTY